MRVLGTFFPQATLSVRLIVPDAREHRDRHTAVPGREEQPLDVPVADFGAACHRRQEVSRVCSLSRSTGLMR